MDALLTRGSELYAVVYFGVILVVALLEVVQPRRVPGETLRQRWFGNFSLTILGAILIRAIFPVMGVGWAIVCEERRLGLLNQVQWVWWAELALTVVVLDFTLYLQHVSLHRIPLLWRLHRTHHSDLEYDFTTGVRFHPFEAIYTTGVSTVAIALLGAPAWAVVIWQALTVAVAFVEHANVRLPQALDRVIRPVFVTPDMHRIHHSQDLHEGESNFSNMFSFWDRLFGTYVAEPAAGHDAIAFGVADMADPRHQTLPGLLAQPFRSSAAPGARTESPAPMDPAASPRYHPQA